MDDELEGKINEKLEILEDLIQKKASKEEVEELRGELDDLLDEYLNSNNI